MFMQPHPKCISLTVVVLTIMLTLSACSFAPPGPDIVIDDIWARQSPMAEGNGAAFMIITNNGSDSDTLLGARSDVSNVVELHETIMEDDVMRMRPIDGQRLEIPAGGEVILKPGGIHVMFIGLNQQLKPGDTFQLALDFEKSGEKTLDVTVRAMEGMGEMK